MGVSVQRQLRDSGASSKSSGVMGGGKAKGEGGEGCGEAHESASSIIPNCPKAEGVTV